MSKVTKKSVNYRTAKRGAKRNCGNCSMFRVNYTNSPGQCTLVQGNIYPLDICDRWAAK